MFTILIIILIFLMLSGTGYNYYRVGTYYNPLGIILIIIIVLLLIGLLVPYRHYPF